MSAHPAAEILHQRWKNLPVEPTYFDECILHPINYIAQENYERRLYCFECEEIIFNDEKGDEIWKTSGSGFMDALPRQTSVMIKNGKHRLA